MGWDWCPDLLEFGRVWILLPHPLDQRVVLGIGYEGLEVVISLLVASEAGSGFFQGLLRHAKGYAQEIESYA
jgi:hypothetical protein